MDPTSEAKKQLLKVGTKYIKYKIDENRLVLYEHLSPQEVAKKYLPDYEVEVVSVEEEDLGITKIMNIEVDIFVKAKI